MFITIINIVYCMLCRVPQFCQTHALEKCQGLIQSEEGPESLCTNKFLEQISFQRNQINRKGEAKSECVWSMSFPLVKLSQSVSGPCLSHWRPHGLHRSILKFMVSPARTCPNSLHVVQKYKNSLKLKEKKAKIIRVNTTKSNMASLLTQAQSSLAHVRVHLPFTNTQHLTTMQ